MAATGIIYYPAGEGIAAKRPRTCMCGSSKFKRTMLPEEQSAAYQCTRCTANYMVPDIEKTREEFRVIGAMLDNLVFGTSAGDIPLRMFVDSGDVVSRQDVIKRMEDIMPLAKMFTDDILCCLEYGTTWAIEETVFEIGEKKIRLTAIVDRDTRIVIHYIMTRGRPSASDIYGLISTATFVAGIPRKIITDHYDAYKPAADKLEKEINRAKKGKVRHISVDARNKSALYQSDGSARKPQGTWAKIRPNIRPVSGYTHENYENMMHYYVINYNFMRPHPSGMPFQAERHNNTSTYNMAPVMRGGYPRWLASFGDLLEEAWGYDKSFIHKIGERLAGRIRVGLRGDHVVISAKKGTSTASIFNLDRKLQVTCGFASDPKKNEWTRPMPSIREMGKDRAVRLADIVPEKTFEVCNRCGLVALTTQQVHKRIGYRRSNGKLITQPNCHKCRSIKSKDPKNPTGPKGKHARRRAILLGRQKTLN